MTNMTRGEIIQSWIDTRRERGEQFTRCSFCFTVPRIAGSKYKDPTFNKVEEILKRNGIEYEFVDTVPGAWNLNRDWIETRPFDCIVEYCGVYPVNWNMDDVVEMERMEYDGEIIINVAWVSEGGKYELNH